MEHGVDSEPESELESESESELGPALPQEAQKEPKSRRKPGPKPEEEAGGLPLSPRTKYIDGCIRNNINHTAGNCI